MKDKSLSRRFILKGSAGVSVSLPLLEVMREGSAEAAPATPPKRFLLGYCGTSLGGDGGSINETLVPSTVGANYDLKPGLANLAAVKNEVTVITGMKIPWGATAPTGGRVTGFHYHSMQPMLTGMRGEASGNFIAPTPEHVAAELVGATTFTPLVLRVQASAYLGSSPGGSGTDISHRKVNGQMRAVPPRYSPQQTFEAMFKNLGGGLTPEQLAEQQWALKNRKSILDGVKQRYVALSQRLGVSDKKRVDDHLQEVRELELRVNAMPPPGTSICSKPTDPGADPTLGGGAPVQSNGNNGYDQNLGYSNEDQRAKVLCDLLHMAYACDLTRSSLFQFTNVQSFLNMFDLIGIRDDCHGISHNNSGANGNNNTVAVGKVVNWHMKHWGYLIGKLAKTKEGDTSLLDSMAAVCVFEGGHGYDSDSGAAFGPHTTEGMMALVSGGAGGLKRGLHIKAPGLHPAQVVLTALRSIGYASNALGEVTGELPGLR